MEEVERRWELKEAKEKINVPTLKEKNELGLSDKDWIGICYKLNKNGKCAREIGAHPLCDLCPKSGKVKETEEWEEEIKTLIAKIENKLISKGR